MLRHLLVNEHYIAGAKVVVFAWEVLDHKVERHMPSLLFCSVTKTS